MKKIILICIAFVLTSISAFSIGPPQQNGEYGASVYCAPDLSFVGPNQVFLGNFFQGTDIDIVADNITWKLTGPVSIINGGDIDYVTTVTFSPVYMTDDNVNLSVKWNIESESENWTNSTAPPVYTDLHLKLDQGGDVNCDGYATFTISAWHIQVQPNAASGLRTWTITMTASASI